MENSRIIYKSKDLLQDKKVDINYIVNVTMFVLGLMPHK